ncbi:hypothetical protein BC751_1396 [Cecembia calidifontis]|uniref:Uncharacterized protein n=1 Tax=Cecembia calidifontis TaxID=1187080 RepID=A0A4Q7P7P0_9BACT|nr:hypothetical protein BC751_1396 [Cecembia calidifontis]
MKLNSNTTPTQNPNSLRSFQETYPESAFKVISPENFYELAGLGS